MVRTTSSLVRRLERRVVAGVMGAVAFILERLVLSAARKPENR